MCVGCEWFRALYLPTEVVEWYLYVCEERRNLTAQQHFCALQPVWCNVPLMYFSMYRPRFCTFAYERGLVARPVGSKQTRSAARSPPDSDQEDTTVLGIENNKRMVARGARDEDRERSTAERSPQAPVSTCGGTIWPRDVKPTVVPARVAGVLKKSPAASVPARPPLYLSPESTRDWGK